MVFLVFLTDGAHAKGLARILLKLVNILKQPQRNLSGFGLLAAAVNMHDIRLQIDDKESFTQEMTLFRNEIFSISFYTIKPQNATLIITNIT